MNGAVMFAALPHLTDQDLKASCVKQDTTTQPTGVPRQEILPSEAAGFPLRSGRFDHWLKVKNPAAPAAKREAEED